MEIRIPKWLYDWLCPKTNRVDRDTLLSKLFLCVEVHPNGQWTNRQYSIKLSKEVA